jgi:hypothetical protein
MNIAQLQQFLDVHGTEPSAWPAHLRGEAEDFINSDAAASRAYAAVRRLDELMRRLSASEHRDDAALRASGERVLRSLPGRLPRQKRAWRWWPAELARFDFAPAWPRVAALASIAIVGFAIGLVGLDGPSSARAPADSDVGASVFEIEPPTGLRP